MKLSELLFEGEYTSDRDPRTIEITRIVSDTAKLERGCLFVCIRGTKHDTHRMMTYISKQGAAAVVVEKGCSFSRIPSLPIFEVKNSREMLAFLWNRFCGMPAKQLHLIGVTGTNGKTSTTHMIHSILCTAGIKAGLIGTIGCKLGDEEYIPTFPEAKESRFMTMTTPDAELLYPTLAEMVQKGVTHVVMEVSSHSLALGRVAPLFFDVGVFTNLSSDHLDMHKSVENYRMEKKKLFLQCAVGIYNQDDPNTPDMYADSPCKRVLCSTKQSSDYTATKITYQGIRGISYIVDARDARFSLKLRLPGEFSVYNSLLAAATASELGIGASPIRKALEQLPVVKGRMERVEIGRDDFCVLIDYAHTEAALRGLLKMVRGCKKPEERIVVLFGCGGDRDATKRAPMGACAMEYADYAIITSDNCRTEDPKAIITDILKGFTNSEKRKVFLSRKKAIEYAVMHAKANDILLLVGKGHEPYEIIGKDIYPFDERKIVQEAIRSRLDAHTTKTENE